jgi:hypothetical protein
MLIGLSGGYERPQVIFVTADVVDSNRQNIGEFGQQQLAQATHP